MKLPRLTGKEVVKILKKAGFVIVRIKGSHFHLYNKEKDIMVTVPCHSKKTLAPKTLKNILNHAGLNIGDI